MKDPLERLVATNHEWMAVILHSLEAAAGSLNAGWAVVVVPFLACSVSPRASNDRLGLLCPGDPGTSFWLVSVCPVGSVIGWASGYQISFWRGRPLLRRLFRERTVNALLGYCERYCLWARGGVGATPYPFRPSAGAHAIRLGTFLFPLLDRRRSRVFSVSVQVCSTLGCDEEAHRSPRGRVDDRLCYPPGRRFSARWRVSAVRHLLRRARALTSVATRTRVPTVTSEA